MKSRGLKSKGQTLVFEQVLLFTIGVAIMITSLALFMMYQNYYLSVTTTDHLAEVKEQIMSNIIKLSEKESLNSSALLEIPQRIGSSYYRTTLSNAGLNITLEQAEDMSDFSPVYGLNKTFNFSGSVMSDRGKIVIYKKGDSIIIQ
jgi:hypothetical protein